MTVVAGALAASTAARADAAPWSAPQPILADQGQVSDLSFAVAGDGRAILGWGEGPFSSRPLYAAVTSSGPPFEPRQEIGSGRDLQTDIAADGSAVATWLLGRTLLASFKAPFGPFGAPVAVAHRVRGGHALDMNEAGRAVVAWIGKARRGKRRLLVASKSPGAGFSAPARVGPAAKGAGRDLRLEVSEGGGALLAWSGKKEYAAFQDPGRRFSRPRALRGSGFSTSPSSSAMAGDGGAMVLVNGGGKSIAGQVRAFYRPPGARRFGRKRVIGDDNRAFASVVADGQSGFLEVQNRYARSGRPDGTEVLGAFSAGLFRSTTHVFPAGTTGSGPAASASGAAVIAGSNYGGADTYIIASYRPPGGAFESPVTLSTATGCDCLEKPPGFIDAAGNAWVVWYQDGYLVASTRSP